MSDINFVAPFSSTHHQRPEQNFIKIKAKKYELHSSYCAAFLDYLFGNFWWNICGETFKV